MVDDDLAFVNKDVSTIESSTVTPADVSPLAAGGHTQGVQFEFIDLSTPALRAPKSTGTAATLIGQVQYLEPPEDPNVMWEVYQLSSFLGPVIEEVVANVYQTGRKLVPAHNWDSEELEHEVKCALLCERNGGDVGKNDIAAKIDELRWRADLEYGTLDTFYRMCCAKTGYDPCVHETGQDLEITGNAYWEIGRNSRGQIARIRRGMSKSIRALNESTMLPFLEPISHPILGVKMIAQFAEFRRYVQLQNDQVLAFFKEFGDPRVISRTTGKAYVSYEALVADEARNRSRGQKIMPMAATEILHLRVPFAGSSVYGKPSYSGTYPGLRGARDLDEFNRRLVVDEEVPSLLLAIAGPRIGQDEIKAIKSQIEEKRKRRGGIIIVNAYNSSDVPNIGVNPTPVMKTEKLKSEQTDDALFQGYESRVEDKSDTSFRLPAALRGKGIDSKKLIAAERFAEAHVFNPRRWVFAQQTSDRLLPAMGIYCWRVVPRANPPRDPEALASVLSRLASYGFVTPNEGRREMEEALSFKLQKLKGPWANIPQKLVTALLQTKNKELASVLVGGDYSDLEQLANGISKVLGLSADPSESGSSGGSTADTGGRFGETGVGRGEGESEG